MLRKTVLAAMLAIGGTAIGSNAQVTFSSQTYALTQTPICGGGNGSSSKSVGTPAGSYTVTITGTSGSLQRSTSGQLTVQ